MRAQEEATLIQQAVSRPGLYVNSKLGRTSDVLLILKADMEVSGIYSFLSLQRLNYLQQQSSARPAKRPRLKGPDGFQVTNSKKFVHKHPPSFVSSFGAPKSSINDLDGNREKSKTSIRSPRECPQTLFMTELPDFGDASRVRREAKGKEKALSVRSADHCEPLEKPSTAANDAEPGSSRAPIVKRPNVAPPKSASVHPPAILPQMKPPSFVLGAPKNASSSTKPLSSILKPPLLHQPSNSKAIIMKPLAPPTLEPSFLKKKPSTDMKAISSFATDPTKDGAGAELLSLFLQQHGHDFVPPLEREIQRGIGLSPCKNKSSKGRFKWCARISARLLSRSILNHKR